VNGFGVRLASVHERHEQEKQIARQADDAVALFTLIFDEVVFECHLIGIAEDFLRRIE
jgi:hypothetical protein